MRNMNRAGGPAIGSRVIVHAAARSAGTDYECHGRAGTVVALGMWTIVRLDKPPRGWRNPVYLCRQHVRPAPEKDVDLADVFGCGPSAPGWKEPG